MRVERLEPDDLPVEVYDRLTSRSFFASRGFLELWRTRGGRPAVWVAQAEGGIAALLPGVEFDCVPLTRFASMPDGCYGGLFVDPAATADAAALSAAILEAVARHGYGRVHVFDFRRTIAATEGYERSPCTATVVELADLARWPADEKLRSQIRKAEREGIEVVPYDPDRHRAALLGLVAHTYRRHGLPPRYPSAFHDALARLAKRDPRVLWEWCEHDGQAACSHIYFVEDGMLQAWQSYFDKRFSFLKPNAFIRYTLALRMAHQGVTRLNLGSTPLRANGLAYYKARWGGREVVFPAHVREQGAAALLAAFRGRGRAPALPLPREISAS